MQWDHIPIYTLINLFFPVLLSDIEPSLSAQSPRSTEAGPCIRWFTPFQPSVHHLSRSSHPIYSLLRVYLSQPLLYILSLSVLKMLQHAHIYFPKYTLLLYNCHLLYSGLVSERLLCSVHISPFLTVCANRHTVSDISVLSATNDWHEVIDADQDPSGFQSFLHVIITHEEFDIHMCKVADKWAGIGQKPDK